MVSYNLKEHTLIKLGLYDLTKIVLYLYDFCVAVNIKN